MNRTKKAWIIWRTLSGPELIFHILLGKVIHVKCIIQMRILTFREYDKPKIIFMLYL